MKVIGITGGIGTGKSTLLNLLRDGYDAYVIEADKLAHKLMMPGQSAYERIADTFGTDILNEDGTINRGRLGILVFQDEEALNRLNGIVHPAVKKYILQDIEQRRRERKVRYYVIEAALLIEDGYKTVCDELWYIYVKKEERIRRLLLGRGGDRKKWEQVMKNQSSEEYYRRHCDVVVDNGKDFEYTANIVNELLS